MRKLKPYVVAAAAALCFLMPLQADSSLTSFYNAISTYNNVTGPTALQGQGMNVYSGGDIYMRNPIQSTQILSYSPPGYRAGCGGIDLWGGSFSFINKQQFVAMLKNIGQNATGYFFMLALQSISPNINSELSKLMAFLQKANGININTCQAGQAIANSVGQEIGLQDAQNGMTVGTFLQNTYNDFTSAYTDQTNANIQAADNYAQNNPSIAPAPVYGNLTWNAIQNTDLPNLFSTYDLELLMTFAGTVVIAPNPQAGAAPTASTVMIQPYTPIGKIDQIVGTTAGLPNDAQYWQCLGGTTGQGSCMNMQYQTMQSSGDQSIMQIVSNNVQNILNAMRARQQLTPQEVAFVQTMPAPIYKIISVVASSGTGNGIGGPAGSTAILDNIVTGPDSQILAYQYAAFIISSVMDKVEQSLSAYERQVGQPDREIIDNMIKQMNAQRTQMYQKLQDQKATVNDLQTMVSTAKAVETAFYGNLSSNLAASISWSRAMDNNP